MDAFDSSDEEREPLEQKYNECGKFIKDHLESEGLKCDKNGIDFYGNGKRLSSWKSGVTKEQNTNPNQISKQMEPKEQPRLQSLRTSKPFDKVEVKMDSFESIFGIKIMNPLITSSTLAEKMAGRNLIPFFKLKSHVQHGDLNNDWCIAGVVVGTNTKVSMKGNNYCIWKVSDLKLGLKTASLFLFGSSYTALWKNPVGTVIGVLNPSVMDSTKDANDEAMLSVFNSQQVMVCGQSKDLGYCKARKKNGDACTQFVNKNHCQFCIYHVQKEYKKFSNGRSNLQSPSGGGGLQNLRNKVLGKNEVFYAGKSFAAIKPAKPVKTKKVMEKDKKLLSNLFGNASVPNKELNTLMESKSSSSEKVEVKFTRFQKIKDAGLLNRLSECSALASTNSRKKETVEIVRSVENRNIENIRKLGNPAGKLQDGNNKTSPLSRTSEINKSLVTETNNTSFTAAEFLSKSFDKSGKNKTEKSVFTKDDILKLVKSKKTEGNKDVVDLVKSESNNGLKKINATNINIKSNEVSSLKKKMPVIIESIKKETDNGNLAAAPKHLNKLFDKSEKVSNVNLKFSNNDNLSPVQANKTESPKSSLCLSNLSNNKYVDLSSPITRRDRDAAKLNALNYIRKNGPIKKIDPSGSKDTKKRKALALIEPNIDDKESLKTGVDTGGSVLSERFIELMNKSSKHDDLLQDADDKFMDEYFLKMSKKEDMEEKMLNTYKVPCKAVRCLKCKYTWFSASDFCKQDQHPIKVVDAMKRFFKCNDCGNRTATFEIIPLLSCKQCGGTNWKRAPLLSEKRTTANLNQLSIRGGEEKFMNSSVMNGNLNLLVPD